MYAIQRVAEELWQITLPNPSISTLPAALPRNIFVLGATNTTLINAGHALQHGPLKQALRELGVAPDRVERIIATSWSVDAIGGAPYFSNADLFVFSPDMIAPTNFDAISQKERSDWEQLADGIADNPAYAEHTDATQRARFFDTYYGRVAEQLDFIPIRHGHKLKAGPLELEVIHTPGPRPGHICLLERSRGLLFASDFNFIGLPRWLDDIQNYITNMEELAELDLTSMLSSYDKPDPWPKFALKRQSRFLTNFLSSVTPTLHSAPTLLEFAERDFGYRPKDVLRFAATLAVYRGFLDELVRSRGIGARGDGLTRRYGVDIDDPRAPARVDVSASLVQVHAGPRQVSSRQGTEPAEEE